jgi:hypothetical protein
MSENSPPQIHNSMACMDATMDTNTNGETTPSIAVLPARYVLLPLANALTGYTVKAMERKIERGDWPEGHVWKRAPDGRILIDLVGYQRWVENR